MLSLEAETPHISNDPSPLKIIIIKQKNNEENLKNNL
jgi:hypothetical protein